MRPCLQKKKRYFTEFLVIQNVHDKNDLKFCKIYLGKNWEEINEIWLISGD
jgi:hypothetical protein